MPTHAILHALSGPLGFGQQVVERLHRRNFSSMEELDQLADAAAPADAGYTVAELRAALAALPPEVDDWRIRGSQSGGWITAVRIGSGVVLFDARYP